MSHAVRVEIRDCLADLEHRAMLCRTRYFEATAWASRVIAPLPDLRANHLGEERLNCVTQTGLRGNSSAKRASASHNAEAACALLHGSESAELIQERGSCVNARFERARAGLRARLRARLCAMLDMSG